MYIYFGKSKIVKFVPRLWAAGAAGTVCPILIDLVPISSGEKDLFLPVVLFAFLGGCLGYTMQRYLFAGLIALAGVAVGVIVDATLDWFFHARDRNLWPLEILIWWAVAPGPMILGALIGKGIRYMTRSRKRP